MPTIKEKADAEAERAEAENPDGEPAEPAEGPAGPGEAEEEEQASEPEVPLEEPPAEDPEAMRKGIDQAMRAFHRKLCAVFGVDDLVAVPTQGALGFMLPGMVERKTHENFTRCLTCNGHGTVDTGSFHAGDETAPCPDSRCKGRGYWQKASSVTAPPQTGPLAVQPQQVANGDYAEAPAWMGDPSLTAGT